MAMRRGIKFIQTLCVAVKIFSYDHIFVHIQRIDLKHPIYDLECLNWWLENHVNIVYLKQLLANGYAEGNKNYTVALSRSKNL